MAVTRTASGVDQYVQKLERTIRNDQERILQGFNIARMYYEVGEMEKALKYVNKYISVQDRDYRALTLCGQIYTATGHVTRALSYYKRSLDLRSDQHDVTLKVGELYCTLKEDVPHRDIKDWLCKVQRIDPTHPLVFKLKEKLLTTTNTIDHCNGLKDIIGEQLTLGIDDEVLHIKLATLYDKSGSLVDAVLYCQSVNESSTVMLCNMKWQLFCLNLYQHYCDSGVEDVQVHISMLQCMDVLLNHMMETKESELNMIIRFDTLLRQIVQSGRLVGSDIFHLLNELSGTLYCHCGKYLLSHHTELSVGLACVIAGLSVMVPDIDQSVVPPHVKDYWKQATYRRISQCGHIIKFVEDNYGYKLTSTSKVTTVQVVKGVYKGKPWDPSKSFIIYDDKFSNLQLHTPNREELQICDVEVIRNDPFRLSFLLWIALCEEETSFIVLCVRELFPQLKTNTNKLSSRCDIDTLCHFDMEAFLVLLLDKLQGEMLKGKDGMELMVTSFSGAIPIEPKHINFWKNVLNLSYRKLSARNSVIIKEQVQKVIAEIRGFKPLRLSLNQLGVLARHFKKRAEEVLECDNSDDVRRLVEALFVNSCHYWKLITDVLKGRVNSVYSPFKQLAQRLKSTSGSSGLVLYSQSVERSGRSSNTNNDGLLDEAYLALGTAALYCKDTNTALRHYGLVNSAHGAYKQCEVYRMMAEKCRVEDPCNSHALLEKASQCVEQAIQRIPHDDDGGLLGQLLDQQKEIETAMDNLKGVEEFYDEFTRFDDEFTKFDDEPQYYSTPGTMTDGKGVLSSSVQQKLPANDQSAVISVLQKQIMELQSQVTMLQEKSFTDSPVSARQTASSSIPTSSSNSSSLFPNVQSSYHSPLASSVSQYNSELPIHSPVQVGSDLAHTSMLPSLPQPGSSSSGGGIFSTGLNLTPVGISLPPLNANLQSVSSASFATSYSIFTSSSDTTYTSSQGVVSSSVGITLPSFNMNFQQFGATTTTAPSSTLSFNLFSGYSPATITSVPQSNGHHYPAMSSSLSIPLLGQTLTTASSVAPAVPSYNLLGSNVSSASAATNIGLFQTSLFSSSSSLLGQGFSSTNTISTPSFNTSTATTSSSTSLFQTQLFSSSGNGSLLGQGFNITNSTVSMPSFNLLGGSMGSTTAATNSGLFQTSYSTSSSLLGQGFNMSSSLAPTSSFNSTASTAGLLQTPSSSLSYQVNLSAIFTSLGQSSSATNTLPVSTGLFQQFPKHTTSSGVFSTSAWPTTTSSSENVTVSDSQPTDDDQPDMLNESQAEDDGYTPLVKLTDSYEVKSGEEYEEELFSSKGKLYRYDQPTKSWKERGIGIMKILQHNSTGKIRVLMRRDQILKICCNHYITGDMELTPLANSNTSWTWMTLSDFSDEQAKVEKLCIRFKLLETAQSFQSVFTECIEKIKNIGEGVVTANKESDEFSTKFAPKCGSWECGTCLIQNEEQASQCVACGSANPNVVTSSNVTSSLGSQKSGSVLSSSGGFKLSGELPSLSQSITQPSADTIKPSGFKLSGTLLSSLIQPTSLPKADNALPSGFKLSGTGLSLNQPTGLPSVNTSTTSTTIDVTESEHSSCEEEDEGSSEVSLETVEVSVSSEAADSSVTGTDFATRFAPKVGNWECSDCFISNEKDVAQCVACGKANPNIKVAATSTTSTASTLSMPSFSGINLPSLPPIVSTANPAGGFKLGGFKLGGLNITAFPGSLSTQDTAHSDSSEDCVITGELTPSEDDIALAQQYMLPPTFYNYKTKPPCPGCRGCEDDETDSVPYISTTEMLPLESICTTTTTATPVFFGASSAGLSSFASLAQNTGFQFGLQKENKGFAGAGAMLFQSKKEEHDGGNVNPEYEADIDFKPLVSLPDIYQVKTGQESEEQLFCERAKLFRFDPNVKQWKERGIGNMTVTKGGKSGRVRLIMRRDQVLKICCNHVLLPDTQLSPMGGAGNAWMWFTPCDFSDEEPKAEQLAVRFKKVEQAESFHLLISKCIQEISATAQESMDEEISKKGGLSDHQKTSEYSDVADQQYDDNPESPVPSLVSTSSVVIEVNTAPGPAEEEQFSANIRFFLFQLKEKKWDMQFDGKMILVKTSYGHLLMRILDIGDAVYDEYNLTVSCKITQMPEEKSWTWSCVNNDTTECVRYAIRFTDVPESDRFKRLISDCMATVGPVVPRSPEIPPLSPSSSVSSTPSRGRGKPLIDVVKPVGMWSCSECNVKNQASVVQCVKCGTLKKPTSFDLPIPSQKENPFYVDGRPVEYSISSVAMGDSATSSTIYSAVHSGSGVPPSLISISDSQQMDRGSDDKDSDSMLSIPSLETASAVPSLETASVAPSSLFGQSRMPKWEPKILFPTEGASVGPGAGGLDSIRADNTEGEPHPEAEANIYFDPVVSLPSSFDATSGEENEDCLFTYKAKLFRYDGSLKVWKDRGIGVIKILKNKTSGKGRVLMRREQILKLCCNHYIVPGMTLRPGSYADRSWVWFTSADLSEDTPHEETLCVKFKYAETASEFKKTFDMFAAPDYVGTSVSQNSVSPRPTPIPVQDSDVLFVGEELPEPELVQLAEQYMLPPTFYNYLKKPPCTGCIGCLEEEEVKSSVNNVVLPGVTIPQVKHNVDLFSSSIDTVSFADLAAANTTGFGGGFGGSGFGSKQGFAGAGKPLFATQTDKDENDAPETFESTAEFKPVVKLSSDFTMSSGEEDEMELFSNRAKLYRYDETINQWKERGVGNIKILRHKKTGRVRILMRRDQVLKICCNHIIVKGMKLVPRDEKSFNWITLSDLADGEPKVEKLAVKFKLTDTATTFQKVFDNSLASGIDDGEGSLNTEASSTIANVTKNANTWECQACYIPNEEFINKCVACGGDRQPTTSSGTCSITLSSALASISMPVTTTPPVSTSSSIMISTMSSTTSLQVTTAVSAPPKPIFVFGGNNQSSQSSQSSATSGSGFSLSPPKFAFGTGTFEFSSPFQVGTKSFPGFGVNTSSSEQSQTSGKNTDDAEVDSQAEEWLTESESEYLGSESNLEHSEDEIDEPSNHEQSVTDTSLTNTTDTSTASVNTVTDEQPEENKLEIDQTTTSVPDNAISGEEQQPCS